MRLESARELKAEVAQAMEQLAIQTYGPAPTSVPSNKVAPLAAAVGIRPLSQKNYQLALRVYRSSDYPMIEQVQQLAWGEVDVQRVGPIRAQRFLDKFSIGTRRERPLRVGLSISHPKVAVGTLGCFVVKRGESNLLILSNNHVLAHENDATVGDPIYQPGRIDGGKSQRDQVATLKEFVSLQVTDNIVDAAIATVEDVSVCHAELRGIGSLKGVYSDEMVSGMQVYKIGRTTGMTQGKIRAIEVDDVLTQYKRITRSFQGVLEIEGVGDRPFSAPGDSGALVVNPQGEAVALVFAGSDYGGSNNRGLTYAIPLPTVLKLMDLELALE